MKNLFGTENWLYEITDDNKARFVLGERGDNPLICVGINPSTAEPNNLDPTLRIVKRWASYLRHDGWIMLNLYPQRATKPDDLHEGYRPSLFSENLKCWYRILGKYKGAAIWAAWGALIEKRKWLKGCLGNYANIAEGQHCTWRRIGELTQAGHPHHPLYLSKTSEVKEFDVQKYLRS